MQFPTNNLDPSSKAWARDVEEKIKGLSGALADTSSRQGNSAAGAIATLQKMAGQIATLEKVVAEQPIILVPAFINSGSFNFANTNLTTRATATITPPVGATFGLVLGDLTLGSTSASNPPTTQVINHQMNMSYPLNIGGTNELIINRFPSLIMPTNAGVPQAVESGGPISTIITMDAFAPGGSMTFRYQTRAAFSGYVGNGSVTANIYGLFFYRPLT